MVDLVGYGFAGILAKQLTSAAYPAPFPLQCSQARSGQLCPQPHLTLPELQVVREQQAAAERQLEAAQRQQTESHAAAVEYQRQWQAQAQAEERAREASDRKLALATAPLSARQVKKPQPTYVPNFEPTYPLMGQGKRKVCTVPACYPAAVPFHVPGWQHDADLSRTWLPVEGAHVCMAHPVS